MLHKFILLVCLLLTACSLTPEQIEAIGNVTNPSQEQNCVQQLEWTEAESVFVLALIKEVIRNADKYPDPSTWSDEYEDEFKAALDTAMNDFKE